jgi:hypothetical protein
MKGEKGAGPDCVKPITGPVRIHIASRTTVELKFEDQGPAPRQRRNQRDVDTQSEEKFGFLLQV